MSNMKLQELKDDVYYQWQSLTDVLPGLPELDFEQFKARVKRDYGDLRKRETWVSAFADIKARFLCATVLDDGQFLLEEFLLNSSAREGWVDLRDRVISRLMEFPDACRSLAYGFWCVFTEYGCEYGATTEKVAAMFNDKQWSFLNLYSQAMQPAVTIHN